MDRPTKIIVNCETGEQTIEELTDEEIAVQEQARLEQEQAQAQAEAEALAIQQAKESAQTKLAALGLTPDEIAALTKS